MWSSRLFCLFEVCHFAYPNLLTVVPQHNSYQTHDYYHFLYIHYFYHCEHCDSRNNCHYFLVIIVIIMSTGGNIELFFDWS
ncbi:hypothetical protein DFH28DRAFT_973876 [Melampsora americana]|nr:hypothetical protein DFH28DRAFT_973876 [Melampsora americana]